MAQKPPGPRTAGWREGEQPGRSEGLEGTGGHRGGREKEGVCVRDFDKETRSQVRAFFPRSSGVAGQSRPFAYVSYVKFVFLCCIWLRSFPSTLIFGEIY